jgi:predicted TIM-barrel fold metal-dependent hydrolase
MTPPLLAERSQPRERDEALIPADAEVVDCDVHVLLPTISALDPYLDDYFRALIAQSVGSGALAAALNRWYATPMWANYPPNAPTTIRPDVSADTADPHDVLSGRVLEQWADRAIVSCPYFVDQFHNDYLAKALAGAINDWLVAEWLERDPRLLGSILVPANQSDLAVEEIERLGAHPAIVQILLPVHSRVPYGNRMYQPIFEAAARYGLVVGIHHGGWPGYPPTSVGWPDYYIETYAGRAQLFQSQLLSLVAEGVFDRLPDLRVSFLESGIAWLPPLLWRFDKDWKGLHRETPWLTRPPSEYVRSHVKFSLQPFDGPKDPGYMELLAEQVGSDQLLMFSTDFPHRHFDSPLGALPCHVDATVLPKLLSDVANRFYRLGCEHDR